MEQYAKMRKAELAAELEKMGIEQPNANMTKEKMLELIEQHSNRRRSPRLRNSSQSPKHLEDVRTRSKSPLSHIKSSPLRNRSKSPLKTESVAKQPIQQEKPTEQVTNGKKKRRNKKNKVIEKRVLLPPSASRQSNIEIEYVEPTLEELGLAENEEFGKIFSKFSLARAAQEAEEEERLQQEDTVMEIDEQDTKQEPKPEWLRDSDDDDEEEDDDKPISKKKQKKLSRYTVAQLKTLVKKAEHVEWVDVTAADPKLLIYLKSYRNSVPVPQHWSAKRRYLATKRTTEKVQYDLPQYLKDTGIVEMRESLREKEQQQNLKAKMRAKVRPKLGKSQIDYQKLHDAFFRFQTKPFMSRPGEMYFEGKEHEAKMRSKRAGIMSEELREALGMTSDPLLPPPWLINMQRFGPPPSYPSLRIPGLNAPIPDGAQWGYHPGGWGKPPVNEYNQPLYGDVFGLYSQYQKQLQSAIEASNLTVPIERELWGQLQEIEQVSEEEEEVSEEEEEEEQEQVDEVIEPQPTREIFGTQTPAISRSGLETPSVGLMTPAVIELRKREKKDEGQEEEKSLYTVIPQRQSFTGSGMMASQFTYDINSSSSKRKLDDNIKAEEMDSGVSGQSTEQLLQSKYAKPAESTEEDLKQQLTKKRKSEEPTNKKKLKDFKF